MKFIIYPFLLLIFTTVFSQAPSIEWEKSYGGSKFDLPSSIFQTADNGYVIAGNSRSDDGDLTLNHGNGDYWIVKISSNGQLEWQKSLGGSRGDTAYSILQTMDGGYMASGFTSSSDGDVTFNHGASDIWVVKLDSEGNIEWEKSYGGTSNETGHNIIQTLEGGYIIAANTSSNDGDVSNNNGGVDYWIIKISSTGLIEWEKNYGGSDNEWAYRILQLADGSYIVAGITTSNDGDVSFNHGGYDYWVVKLSSIGSIEWEKTFGGSLEDSLKSIDLTQDGGFILGGHSKSLDGDVSINYGARDFWILKLSGSGNIQWEKSFGGTLEDFVTNIEQAPNGDYIISGYTGSNDGHVSNNYGGFDYWLVKTNSSGSIIWTKCYGGSNWDLPADFTLTSDNSIALCGRSESIDGDVSENKGGADYWIVKLESNILDITEFDKHIILYPNPVSEILKINSKFPVKRIIIYNSLGQQVFLKTINDSQFQINISSLPEGTYLAKIISKDIADTQKFIIKRE
ncbi:T9SS type A sorting domain-containing protein [Aequorivita antarctica]|uniref:T9SS type A sorting domain-containing protein n=1 Tax=Aequorivita antarctica TaxID=153266 RepID=A0A5C6Z5Y9_9FLAO|nr:T9SS type A sorting domain-containing protein [Aequorivita antarctica]TXD74824.1 T9SS type A sorting domain-containing protein [Aequorivita antarctica]SRX72472.1 hypothetical protein AEQU3_00294 [Aequorivita antarctica]